MPTRDDTATPLSSANPFFAPSTLPFGVPHFDRVRIDDYLPAFHSGMAEQREEVNAIVTGDGPATFQNTLIALEVSGALLDRVATAFFTVASANTSSTIQQLQEEIAPLLSAHSDAINLDERLFARVRDLYERRAELGLDAESQRLLDVSYDGFVRSGALLAVEDKDKLRALNTEQASIQATFLNRILTAMKEGGLRVETREELDGLAEPEIEAAAEAAHARGLTGFYISLENTTNQPFLARMNDRSTRERLWQCSLTRAEAGNGHDTRECIARLAQVRALRAKLLGFESYAAWKLTDQMARTPSAAVRFLDALVPAALAVAAKEAEAMQAAIDADGDAIELAPWDWEYYAERVRKERYDLNQDDVASYFELGRVFHDGVLFAAEQLFGLRFVLRAGIPGWHSDVTSYEVCDEAGEVVALLMCDFYRRDSKRGGAWMSSLVSQGRILRRLPVISMVCNFPAPTADTPCLLTSDHVDTLFHEFGHALHGMLSDVEYPSLSGTAVPRDFVEFPSQFNEHWSTDPAVFRNYARHYATGEVMPDVLQAKLRAAKNFNGGHALTEVLAAAELDMQWHTLSADADVQKPSQFEEQALETKGVKHALIPPRYRSTFFSHVFGGGYAAGYYAYLWAEMLDADAYAFIAANGGLTRANGESLRAGILSRGNTLDPAEMYRQWRGQDPVIGPMLEMRSIDAAAVLRASA